MDWFGIVKRHYDAGRYNDEQVAVFVAGNKITTEQYQQITGTEYGSAT
ncbi:XkdX family protein [Paenibacillus sp. CAU 1782]